LIDTGRPIPGDPNVPQITWIKAGPINLPPEFHPDPLRGAISAIITTTTFLDSSKGASEGAQPCGPAAHKFDVIPAAVDFWRGATNRPYSSMIPST